MLNTVVLIGRLTRDPEIRYGTSGKAVTNLRLAVDRNDAEKTADFIDIVCFEKLAEIVSAHLQKGRLVAVQGRLQVRQFEHEGKKREKTEVVANTVRFLDRGQDTPGGPKKAGGMGEEPNFEDDVPF